MTLDEAIKHAEEVAEEQEKAAKEWHENQVRKCELFSFAEMDYTHENECKKCAKEHRQLAEWLKELKQLREQTRWIPVGERLPKEKGNYLVCYNDGYISVSEWNPNPYEKVCFDLFPSLIVAWMPMPIMPYKAESEDKE